jgi:hypothetical protein
LNLRLERPFRLQVTPVELNQDRLVAKRPRWPVGFAGIADNLWIRAQHTPPHGYPYYLSRRSKGMGADWTGIDSSIQGVQKALAIWKSEPAFIRLSAGEVSDPAIAAIERGLTVGDPRGDQPYQDYLAKGGNPAVYGLSQAEIADLMRRFVNITPTPSGEEKLVPMGSGIPSTAGKLQDQNKGVRNLLTGPGANTGTTNGTQQAPDSTLFGLSTTTLLLVAAGAGFLLFYMGGKR